jgi:hypothetical protein
MKQPFPFLILIDNRTVRALKFNVLIKFSTAPNREQRSAIIKSAPSIFNVAQRHFHSSFLVVSSGMYPFKEIQRLYGSGVIQRDGVSYAIDTPTALNSFYDALRDWIFKVNEASPIQVVLSSYYDTEYKMEDHFPENTTRQHLIDLLDKWERTSIQDYDEYELPHLEKLVEFIIALPNLDQKTCLYLMEKFLPAKFVVRLLQSGAANELQKLILSKLSDQYFEKLSQGLMQYVRSAEANDQIIFAAVSMFLEMPAFTKFLNNNVGINAKLVAVALRVGNRKCLKLLMNAFLSGSQKGISRNMQGIYWWTIKTLVPSKDWRLSVEMYHFVIDVLQKSGSMIEDKSFYANCLWIMQNDNTGLPVNRSLNRKFLSACLPIGRVNPTVFYNAACLYIEMGNIEDSFNCIRNAVEAGLRGRDYSMMMNDVSKHPLFESLRERTDVQDYLAALPRQR